MSRLGKTKTKTKAPGTGFSPPRSSSVRGEQHTNHIHVQRREDMSRSAAALTRAALDVVRQMLLYLDPDAASLLPLQDASAAPALQAPIPISRWNVLYSTPAPSAPSSSKQSLSAPYIQVLSYPTSDENLFCVRSRLNVDAKQFWTLMAESGNRHLWDSTTQEGSNHRFFSSELSPDIPEHAIAKGLSARLEYLKFGSIFMVAKPRDMVLLSADVRLPPTSVSDLRLVSACRSEVDAAKPPVKGYTRYELGVGGFMVEELTDPSSGGKCCQVTQLSNLGSAASWVPASVVRMVAQTMVPRSVALISKAARSITIPQPLKSGVDSGDTDPKEEVVYKGKERWSKARTLPDLIGQGVFELRKTRSQHNLDPQQSSTGSVFPEEVLPSDTSDMPTTDRLPSLRIKRRSKSNCSDNTHTATAERSDPEATGNVDPTQSPQLPPSTETDSTYSAVSRSSGEAFERSIGATDETGNTSESQVTSMTESGTSSPTSSENQEPLRLTHADEVSRRLKRISVALQSHTGENEESRSLSSLSPIRWPPGKSVTIPSKLETELHSSDASFEEDEDVNNLLAEALSISLSSPQLQSHLAARSPDRPSSKRINRPSSPHSPVTSRARREASQLSAILLSGSDALVSALAPGARERVANDGPAAGQSSRQEMIHHSPPTSVTKGRTSARDFSLASRRRCSRPVALPGSATKTGICPPALSRAVTQTTSAHALSFPVGADDISLRQGGHDVALTSWKNALNSTPYALELGQMAMLWTSEAVNYGRPIGMAQVAAKSIRRPEGGTQRHQPTADLDGASSPAVLALRYASASAILKSKPRLLGRSFSSPAH